MTDEQSWDDGVIWGPPCQCGGEYIPHRHGSSSNVNSTWIQTSPMSNIDSSDDRLQAIADARNTTETYLPRKGWVEERVIADWSELAAAIKDALTEEKR